MRRLNMAAVMVLVGAFVFFSALGGRLKDSRLLVLEPEGRVVVSAPVLMVLFGGDRFLAANLETMRLAATGVDYGISDTAYLVRAQREVAILNPCQEDNYYLANGLLAWGGADAEGIDILRKAMDCRFWDEFPAFFYGFNQAFFNKNIAEASRALDLAARRSTDNSAGFRKLAVVLRAESLADEELALNYLLQQRDAARSDEKLYQMLDKRAVRLQGLLLLRGAQRRFERESGKLHDLKQLVDLGYLSELPQDPLRLGYDLKDGLIVLKRLQIDGMEEQP